ncbi:putative C6 transcription factor (AmyR) [Aspergillus clavatus NRRL 1]|uniref:C6 transcription factor (AmyR), putative n=1 Tax=Aspergillus clavatus (strain ATCC 1007 / CBS 513.65 / DSM 816 / NCTC 3887 / NRRL 1 / QM 1276 / 107) TaxID=344612 RepID=A1CHW1_ASPCL|nr:C6 transcription factor (AmyR), putative [Aspergillus clavatus NRRL 1]EAW10466.1 C6 transcription factor (AmyR), putative [Aspergillus clavatus NRRL 1]
MNSPSDTPTKPERKSFKQACDNCRRRKIKCSRELPCDKCSRLLLSCSYSDVLRRKGPKFRTLYPLAPIHPLISRPRDALHYDPRQHPLDKEMLQDNGVYQMGASPTSPPFSVIDAQFQPQDFMEPFARLPPPELVSSPESTNSLSDSGTGHFYPFARRLSSPVLLAHVNVYFKYLFPIMPVVRKDELQADCHQPERLTPQRYALLAALCAATHIQLKLDGAMAVSDPSAFGTDGQCTMSGEELLAEAVRARKESDPTDDVNIDSLLTSFFVFTAYSNQDKQEQAWFYLSQATSMIFTLGLHREATYAEFSPEEAEEKRKVFWLLFVSERGYALQQAKPVLLRNSIHKPQVLSSEDPILAYGFVNLINVFEKLTPNLYDWVSTGGGDAFFEMPPTSAIQSSLCKPMSLDGVVEIQRVDILVTQQWLQVMMWKLSMTHATQPGSRDDAVLPFHLPILVGKSVMNAISAASQGSVDAHGIGMEQKLFDVGMAVADVTRSLGSKAAQHLADPRELLWAILSTLSRIRGAPSYLFPTLLERSKSILGLDCSVNTSNFLPLMAASAANPGAAAAAAAAAPPPPFRNQHARWDLLAPADEQQKPDEAAERSVAQQQMPDMTFHDTHSHTHAHLLRRATVIDYEH